MITIEVIMFVVFMLAAMMFVAEHGRPVINIKILEIPPNELGNIDEFNQHLLDEICKQFAIPSEILNKRK